MERRDFVRDTGLSAILMLMFGTAASAFDQRFDVEKFDFMTSAHPNQKLIQNFFKAYGANDLKAIEGILAKDIKWHIPGSHQLSGTKKGIPEVLAFFKKLQIGAFKAEPLVMGVNDDYVIDCHKNWSNVKEGENMEGMSCLLWHIKDGMIQEVFNFPQDQMVVDRFFNQLYQ